MEFAAIQGPQVVLGASGPITFSADYASPGATGSNPVGKVISMLQLTPSGALRFLALEP